MARPSYARVLVLVVVFLLSNLLLSNAYGDVAADLKSAQRAVRLRDYSKAFSIYLQTARAGNAEAQYQLANLYEQGKGAGVSESLALEWLRKSAAQQHAAAQYSLAMKLLERDSDQATTLLRASAAQHYTPALTYLDRLGDTELDELESAADQQDLWFGAARKNLVNDLQRFAAAGIEIDRQDRANRTALFVAIENDSAAAVNWLLKNHADPNHADKFGITPSHVAITHHRNDALNQLFSHSADRTRLLPNGDNLLHYAIRQGNADFVASLLKLGVNANHSNNDHWTPLDLAEYLKLDKAILTLKNNGASHGNNWTRENRQWDANAIATQLTANGTTDLTALDLSKIVVSGNTALLKQIMVAGNTTQPKNSGIINQRLPDESTLLALAIKGEQRAMVDALLQAGADANLNSSAGLTPLHIAVASGRVDIIERLLQAGADPSLVNDTNLDPVSYGIDADKTEACVAVIDWLVTERSRQLDPGKFGQYLIKAAENGNTIIAEHVIGNAAANAMDTVGRNPLWYAARNQDPDMIELLLRHKSATDVADNFGKTPFYVAVESGCLRCAELLLPFDDVNRATRSQSTPLMAAARNGNVALVSWLLAQKADSKARNEHGDSALIEAVKANSVATAKALMSGGANPTRKNKIGLSAIDFAKNNEEMMAVLQTRSVLDLF